MDGWAHVSSEHVWSIIDRIHFTKSTSSGPSAQILICHLTPNPIPLSHGLMTIVYTPGGIFDRRRLTP